MAEALAGLVAAELLESELLEVVPEVVLPAVRLLEVVPAARLAGVGTAEAEVEVDAVAVDAAAELGTRAVRGPRSTMRRTRGRSTATACR